ncbi:Kinesin-like protein kip2 [Rhodotorula kratochvilovae]
MATPTTPRRPLQTTRPSARASSRPASPVKPSSNTPAPRPSSRASGALPSATAPRASASADAGRTSPTKRPSSALGGSSISLTSRAASPTKPRTARPTSSLTSLRSSVTGAGARTSAPSSLAPSASFGDGVDEDTLGDDRPRRRPGFGSLTPSTPSRRVAARESALTEASEADELDEDGPLRSSIVERADEVGATSSGDEAEDDGTETETEEDEKDGKRQNVVVCLRVRPPKGSDASIYTLDQGSSTLALAPTHPSLTKRFGSTSNVPKVLSDEYEFRFDLLHVHPSPTSELYDRKIRPVVKAALGGFNGTVFAYGQTASGKTHTMTGSPSEPGIIPLAVDELFARIRAQRTRRSFALRVAFLEIYNEQLRDLLAPASPAGARALEIVENGAVKGLTEREVALPGDVLEVLREGETRRRVGATDWNERSSRSHCVFIVTIESRSDKDGSARMSKLNLIDLAGSESATGQEDRRKEGAFINKSLLALSSVISKLTDPSASSAHIPFRDSKLTRLLQPALSGNSRVAVVCTVSPDAEQAAETLGTLKFAKRAKMVVTKAERGVLVTKDMLLTRHTAEIARLRASIAALESSALLSERDSALSRADAAEARASSAAAAVEAKDAELARLRAALERTRSLVLTGPELERLARRVSGAMASAGGAWDEVLSPSRSRSLRGAVGTPGKRCASEMSALGLGTPSARGRVRASVGGRLAEEDEYREKEATLKPQLASAQDALAALTASSAAELSSLQSQLEASTSAGDTLRARVADLESERARLSAELATARAERDALRAELVAASERSNGLEAQLAGAEERLTAAEAARAFAASALEASNAAAHAKDAHAAELEARLAAHAAASGPRAEAAASLSREVALVRAELASVSAARDAALLAGEERARAVEGERDLALQGVEAAEARVRQVEELSALAASERAASDAQTAREREAAERALQAELDRARGDLRAQVERADALERRLKHFERLEDQRATYERNQRAGTDALKSRLASLQARSATPVRADGAGRTSSAGSEGAAELQVRNEELAAKLGALEREAEERRAAEARAEEAQREARQLRGAAERQERMIEETEARAEDWRQKYLAVQRLLDQLTAAPPPAATTPPSSDTENRRPSSLFLPSTSSSAIARASSTSRRPPLAASQTPSQRGSFNSPSASGGGSGTWLSSRPPPLPYSPHQRDGTASERKKRRETIAKDLERLKEGRAVGAKREGWDSPGAASPTKSEFGSVRRA